MARTRRPLIAGNWKMNGLSADGLALAKAVADGVKQARWSDREVLICPPATLVRAVAETVRGSGALVGGPIRLRNSAWRQSASCKVSSWWRSRTGSRARYTAISRR